MFFSVLLVFDHISPFSTSSEGVVTCSYILTEKSRVWIKSLEELFTHFSKSPPHVLYVCRCTINSYLQTLRSCSAVAAHLAIRQWVCGSSSIQSTVGLTSKNHREKKDYIANSHMLVHVVPARDPAHLHYNNQLQWRNGLYLRRYTFWARAV